MSKTNPIEFFQEVREETSKVTWPMRKETGISTAMVFLFVFVLNKMMAVFSMLFGAGILLITGRVESRGHSSLGVHYARNLLLVAIGVAHSALWFGDILLIYGLSALFMYPARRLPAAMFVGSGSIM